MENTIKLNLDGIANEIQIKLNDGTSLQNFNIDSSDLEKKKANVIEMAQWMMKTVSSHEIIKFALPDENMKSRDELCKSFVNYTWHDLPEFFKTDEYFPTKKNYLEHCIDYNSEKNLFRYVMTSFQAALERLINRDKVVKHNFFVWGLTGSGKTTLIAIIASTLNQINPNSDALRNLKIDANKVGTKEISDPIEFSIGAMQLCVKDVPGTEDYNALRSHCKLIQGIEQTGDKVDSILFTQNIGEQCRPNQTAGEKATLYTLASAFKTQGLKFWERVIICLTKTNKFSSEAQKPIYQNNFDDEEMAQYLDDYKDYLEEYNKELDVRIQVAKDYFKENWMDLFKTGRDKVYDNVSERAKEQAYSKIRFVVCGTVQKNNKFKNEPNPFMNSTILSLPNFETIPNLANITPDNQVKIDEINNALDEGKYVKYNNWVNELYNKIIESSTTDFKINCTTANYETLRRREEANENAEKNEQEGRRPNIGGVRMNQETRDTIARDISSAMKEQSNTDTAIEWTFTGVGTAAGGVAAAAFTGAWVFILGGCALGGGAGYGTGRGIINAKDWWWGK